MGLEDYDGLWRKFLKGHRCVVLTLSCDSIFFSLGCFCSCLLYPFLCTFTFFTSSCGLFNLLIQFDVPGGSVRYILITEDVVNGKIPPLYFGRDGKVYYTTPRNGMEGSSVDYQEQFHETIMREEDAFLKLTESSQRDQPSSPPVSKSKASQPPQREAYMGIP